MKTKNFPIIYFLTRSLFLGITYSNIINSSGKDSLLACIIGTILGILVINKFHNIDKNKNKILLFITYLSFIILNIITIENFITSYFLKTTPRILIIMPFILLALYAAKKKEKNILYSANILFFFSVVLFSTAFICLTKYFDLTNLTPMFHTDITGIIKSSLIYCSFSAIPNLLFTEQISKKEHIIFYSITSLLNILILFAIISSLSVPVAKIYSYPEYMTLKRINILNFIENIENLITPVWYLDLFFFLTLTIKRMIEISNKYSYLIILITTLFVTYFLIQNYTYILFIYHYLYIFYLIIIILLHKKKTIKGLNPS